MKRTARLFVAIPFEEEVRSELVSVAAPLRAADTVGAIRWVRPEQLHLTLRFLGEVDRGRVSGIGDELRRSVSLLAPFFLELSGTGAFPNRRHPHVIWVGVRSTRGLERAFSAVEGALGEAGFDRESRPFKPHVTLGRVRRGRETGPEFRSALETVGARLASSVTRVDLIESRLSPSGAEHRVVTSCAFGVET